MSTTNPIVVAVKDSPQSEAALGWAASRARKHHVPLVILHVADDHWSLNPATWNKQLRKAGEELLASALWQLPERIHFRAVDLEWEVRARESSARRLSINYHRPGLVEIQGPVEDEVLGRHLLGRFLVVQAELHLPRLLSALSRGTNLPYRRVSIRRQRSRACFVQWLLGLRR